MLTTHHEVTMILADYAVPDEGTLAALTYLGLYLGNGYCIRPGKKLA
jgi:hypothetical protein